MRAIENIRFVRRAGQVMGRRGAVFNGVYRNAVVYTEGKSVLLQSADGQVMRMEELDVPANEAIANVEIDGGLIYIVRETDILECEYVGGKVEFAVIHKEGNGLFGGEIKIRAGLLCWLHNGNLAVKDPSEPTKNLLELSGVDSCETSEAGVLVRRGREVALLSRRGGKCVEAYKAILQSGQCVHLVGQWMFLMDDQRQQIIARRGGEEATFSNDLDIEQPSQDAREPGRMYHLVLIENWGEYASLIIVGHQCSIDFLYFVERGGRLEQGFIAEDADAIQLPIGTRMQDMDLMFYNKGHMLNEDGQVIRPGPSIAIRSSAGNVLLYDSYMTDLEKGHGKMNEREGEIAFPSGEMAGESGAAGKEAGRAITGKEAHGPPEKAELDDSELRSLLEKQKQKMAAIGGSLRQTKKKLEELPGIPQASPSLTQVLRRRPIEEIEDLVIMMKDEEIRIKEALRSRGRAADDAERTRAAIILELMRRRIEDARGAIARYSETSSTHRKIEYINARISSLFKEELGNRARAVESVDPRGIPVYSEAMGQSPPGIDTFNLDTKPERYEAGERGASVDAIEECLRRLEVGEGAGPENMIEHIFDDEVSREFIESLSRVRLGARGESGGPKERGAGTPEAAKPASVPIPILRAAAPPAASVPAVPITSLVQPAPGLFKPAPAAEPRPLFSSLAPRPAPAFSLAPQPAPAFSSGPAPPGASPSVKTSPLFANPLERNTLSILGGSSKILRGNPNLSLTGEKKDGQKPPELGSLFKAGGSSFLNPNPNPKPSPGP